MGVGSELRGGQALIIEGLTDQGEELGFFHSHWEDVNNGAT